MTQTDSLPRAVEALLDRLAEKTGWTAELEEALAQARRERADTLSALAPLLRGLDRAARDAAERRMGALAAQLAGSRARVGQTRVTRAALAFLAEAEVDEIRPCELTWYLRRMDLAVAPQHAPTLLRDWAGRGVVARTGHGVYRINRVHPEVLRLRFAAVDRCMAR